MSGRGRQAEAARNDRLLLDAAREVFAAQGAGASVAAIAGRAGVGIGSLYRRYATKQELQQHLCVLAMEQASEAAERGLAADDAWAGLAGYIGDCVAFGTGALAPLAGQIPVSERMWQTARRGRQLADRLVARAHQAGVLRADVTALDISLLMELFSRRSPIRAPGQDQAHRQRLLAIALDGLRAPARQPLPGQPPSQQEYEAPWRAG
ncbi:MAG: TetR/AcrR family transcriptional regulator [Nocardiopsaceae bacterium]|jgi:AcrR family transcriptional regulator|nr:TetR/AcrR family transcriptional regulator [Nocardiopsaceae bacterium]